MGLDLKIAIPFLASFLAKIIPGEKDDIIIAKAAQAYDQNKVVLDGIFTEIAHRLHKSQATGSVLLPSNPNVVQTPRPAATTGIVEPQTNYLNLPHPLVSSNPGTLADVVGLRGDHTDGLYFILSGEPGNVGNTPIDKSEFDAVVSGSDPLNAAQKHKIHFDWTPMDATGQPLLTGDPRMADAVVHTFAVVDGKTETFLTGGDAIEGLVLHHDGVVGGPDPTGNQGCRANIVLEPREWKKGKEVSLRFGAVVNYKGRSAGASPLTPAIRWKA